MTSETLMKLLREKELFQPATICYSLSHLSHARMQKKESLHKARKITQISNFNFFHLQNVISEKKKFSSLLFYKECKEKNYPCKLDFTTS